MIADINEYHLHYPVSGAQMAQKEC